MPQSKTEREKHSDRFNDLLTADLRARLDPLLLEASAEVDRGLLRWSLSQSPLERLRGCTEATRTLSRFRRVASEAG